MKPIINLARPATWGGKHGIITIWGSPYYVSQILPPDDELVQSLYVLPRSWYFCHKEQ